jgi:predicted dehydrogenase
VHAVADFVEAVVKGTTIDPDFRDGLRCIRVLEAGLRSAESGKRELV